MEILKILDPYLTNYDMKICSINIIHTPDFV